MQKNYSPPAALNTSSISIPNLRNCVAWDDGPGESSAVISVWHRNPGYGSDLTPGTTPFTLISTRRISTNQSWLSIVVKLRLYLQLAREMYLFMTPTTAPVSTKCKNLYLCGTTALSAFRLWELWSTTLVLDRALRWLRAQRIVGIFEDAS